MAARMELVAGDRAAILKALAAGDADALDDRRRFPAHLSLGGGLDPTWLDMFSEACRSVSGSSEPDDFLDARRELDTSEATGGGQEAPAPDEGDRPTIELVDPAWVAAVARVPSPDLDHVAGHWIDLLDEEIGPIGREDKPWIRGLAADLVAFARAAVTASDVVFAWSL
jgi:hypothetical protein